MPTKKVHFDYFRIHSVKSAQLDTVLADEERTLKSGLVHSIKVFDYFARIRAMSKVDKMWIVDLEKLNVLDEAYIGDLQGNRQTLATGDDQGPLFDTIFLFDPVTEVLVVQRNRSGIGIGGLRKYLSELLQDEDLDLEIVLDETAYRKFERMSMIQEVEYTVAKPKTLRVFRDDYRSADGDLDLMQKLDGERMYVKIGASRNSPLNLEAVKNKVRRILRYRQNEDFESSTLKVKGMVNGEIDTLDLIKKRLVYPKKFNLTRGRKVTPPLLMDAVIEAYRAHEQTLKALFVSRLEI